MNNEFLRHTLATIKYRFEKAVIDSSENFGTFSLGKGSRSPEEIVRHMYQVLRATRFMIEEGKLNSDPVDENEFNSEIERFNNELILVDKALDQKEQPINYTKKLLQGPLSDVLTHIGQIAMLQRLNDHPVKGENFSSADIITGIS